MRDEKDDKVNVDENPGTEKLYPRQRRQKNVGVAGPDEKITMRRKIVVETPRKQFPRQRRQKMLSRRLTRQRSDRGLSL